MCGFYFTAVYVLHAGTRWLKYCTHRHGGLGLLCCARLCVGWFVCVLCVAGRVAVKAYVNYVFSWRLLEVVGLVMSIIPSLEDHRSWISAAYGILFVVVHVFGACFASAIARC